MEAGTVEKRETLVELRCPDCNRLIGRAAPESTVELVCKRCGKKTKFEVKDDTLCHSQQHRIRTVPTVPRH